ncbi:MAG: chorismate synthase, partial [Candidatus Eremiobacterota bacterium]
TTCGASHGGAVGGGVDGCPPGLPLDESDVQGELDRRRPGQSAITTPRDETDAVQFLSGVFEGVTLGTPIAMLVWNQDARPEAYQHLKDLYRPSHADYTYEAKYGLRNWQGGGRASARETIGRVAAGAVARKFLARQCGVEILAWVRRIHDLEANLEPEQITREQVESNIVRCPDPVLAQRMVDRILQLKEQGDSVGGVIEAVARNVPAGLGEPVFDRLEAELAHGMLSLPAVKGFEVGSGFAGTCLTGFQHNDPFFVEDGRVRTRSNRSGGIQGGISNGEPVWVRVAFKPTATISAAQETVNRQGKSVELLATGRHDPCVLPRAVPIVEAMMALVLMDHFLRWRGQCGRC